MNIDTNGFELGDVVREPHTGFEGTIIGMTQWLTGCARAVVQPRMKKNGAYPENQSVDVLILEMVEVGPRHEAAEPTLDTLTEQVRASYGTVPTPAPWGQGLAAVGQGGPMPTPKRR